MSSAEIWIDFAGMISPLGYWSPFSPCRRFGQHDQAEIGRQQRPFVVILPQRHDPAYLVASLECSVSRDCEARGDTENLIARIFQQLARCPKPVLTASYHQLNRRE